MRCVLLAALLASAALAPGLRAELRPKWEAGRRGAGPACRAAAERGGGRRRDRPQAAGLPWFGRDARLRISAAVLRLSGPPYALRPRRPARRAARIGPRRVRSERGRLAAGKERPEPRARRDARPRSRA